MRRLLLILVVAVLAVPAAAEAMNCQVHAPISAAELNATDPAQPWLPGDPGTWSFSVSGGTPNATYAVKIQWAGDPSNGGHPNAGASTDAFGNGTTTLARLGPPSSRARS